MAGRPAVPADQPNVEVELRCLLDDGAMTTRLRQYLQQHATKTATDRRLLIDYSTFIEGVANRTRDIRVRSTNGRAEVVVKEGAFGATARTEYAYQAPGKSLIELATLMGHLGYGKGVVALRYIERWQMGDIEISITEVRPCAKPGQIYATFVECEILTTSAHTAAAITKIRQFIASQGLTELKPADWYAFIERLNREANAVFDFANPNWQLIDDAQTLLPAA